MKRILPFLALLLSTTLGFAQDHDFWQKVKEQDINPALFANRLKPKAFQLFRLNELQFRSKMLAAPEEKTVAPGNSAFIITIPNAEGLPEQFRVVESSVMHPGLAARYPGIKSYLGSGITEPGSTIRFTTSPLGFSGSIISSNRSTVYINPVETGSPYYMVVSRKNLDNIGGAVECGVKDAFHQVLEGNQAHRAANDGTLRTYRLALAASGEFSQFWLNGTETSDAERKGKVLAALVNAVAQLNVIYERDFSVRVILVPNNDAVIYLDAATDPWTSSNLNSGTQTTIDNVIGNANYDVGHLAHRAPNNGNAGTIGCVCKTGLKGSGWSSYLDLNSIYFVVDYLTHEMGHQFGANHTYSRNEGFGVNMEPGSGSTIMSYAGITGPVTDVQPHNDDYFHSKSLDQVTAYIKSATGGAACPVNFATGNTAPTANAGADYIIPRSTPFVLTGASSDVDGDLLSHDWEQLDLSSSAGFSVPVSTNTTGPMFRCIQYAASTSRTFPTLASVLDGTNGNKWEVLPSVGRNLNFRFSARDNRAGGGSNESDDMLITVNGASGPFAVTSPNSNITWGEGLPQTITWSVNGTDAAPVNCTSVNILLSTDGGQTFPTILAGATANDGSEVVTLPIGQSATCRIKIEAVGNIFFDISNTNFTIGPPPACGDVSGLLVNGISTSGATLNWTAVAGATGYDVDYKLSSSGTWTNAATGTTATSVALSGLASGSNYDWRVRSVCTAGAGNYAAGQFTTATPPPTCPGIYDVSTNGTIGGAAQIPLNTDVRGTISTGTDIDYYKFVITTGGTITISLTTLPANYDLRLYNSAGAQVASSARNGTSNESIATTVAAGTWYARVIGRTTSTFNATSCYTLRVATGTASREGDFVLAANGLTQVRVFPNPMSQVLNISLNRLEGRSSVSIFDINGRNLASQAVTEGNTAINLSKIPAGIYLIKIIDSEGKLIYQEKLVKE